MSKFENPLPEWYAEGIEPSKSQKERGWREGVKPPAQWHNWWMYTSYQSIKEIRDYLENLEMVMTWNDIEDKPTNLETTDGAQEKADEAEQNAKAYTDEEISKIPDPTWENVEGKPATFPPSDHDHSIGDVYGLLGELDGKASQQDYDRHITENMPHQYGNRFAWQYNPDTDSLDLVVFE